MSTRLRNPRGQGERLRDDIVAAAADLLEAAGREESVSLRAVARHVGIAAPSIYGHFADRAAMHEAVIDLGFRELSAALHETLDAIPADQPVERLRAGCRVYLRLAEERPQRYRFMFGPQPEPPGDDAGDPDRSVPGLAAFEILVEGVAECARQGYSDSTDACADATALWVGLHGLATLRVSLPGFPWPDGETLTNSLIDRLARLR